MFPIIILVWIQPGGCGWRRKVLAVVTELYMGKKIVLNRKLAGNFPTLKRTILLRGSHLQHLPNAAAIGFGGSLIVSAP